MPDRDLSNHVDAAYKAVDAAVIDAYHRGTLAERKRVRDAIAAIPTTNGGSDRHIGFVMADVLGAVYGQREVGRGVEGDPED